MSPTTWNSTRKAVGAGKCRALARLARGILTGQQRLHLTIGDFAGWVVGRLGSPPFARRLAEEIASRVPLPFIDDNAVIAARGVQIIGITMCALDGRNLIDCACFQDVVIEEGKARVQELLGAAAQDWVELRLLAYQERSLP
ncbi:hypothetical protein [Polymorphospora lycopeni]|uniref:Uncharacterized protein n=1 Tax=Polymorphospora lycopeni TaxID=3140240 RepID=A0ABV5CYI5_9ACTN